MAKAKDRRRTTAVSERGRSCGLWLYGRRSSRKRARTVAGGGTAIHGLSARGGGGGGGWGLWPAKLRYGTSGRYYYVIVLTTNPLLIGHCPLYTYRTTSRGNYNATFERRRAIVGVKNHCQGKNRLKTSSVLHMGRPFVKRPRHSHVVGLVPTSADKPRRLLLLLQLSAVLLRYQSTDPLYNIRYVWYVPCI